jgi:hypothetical protein
VSDGGSVRPPYTPPVEKAPKDPPPRYRLIWAVRAVPALVILGTLDLLPHNPPTWFLVLTLVRLGLGLLTMIALKFGAREEWCAAYVAVVFVSCLVHPELSPILLAFSAVGLVMTGVDLYRGRRDETAQSGQV